MDNIFSIEKREEEIGNTTLSAWARCHMSKQNEKLSHPASEGMNRLQPEIHANEGMIRRRDSSPGAHASLSVDDDMLREILLHLPTEPSRRGHEFFEAKPCMLHFIAQ